MLHNTGPQDAGSQDFLDFLNEGVLCCDAEQRIVRLNRAAQRLLGISAIDHLSIDQLIAELGLGSEALKQLQVGSSSMLVIGGALIEAKKEMLAGGMVILLSDRSEELRWQSQLAEHGHMLAANSEAYLVIDGRGIIRYANNFCERERGYAHGEMVGLLLSDVELGRDEDGVSSRVYTQAEMEARLERCLRRGQVERYEAWHARKDDSIFPTAVNLRPYRMSNETVLLLTAQDETNRYQQLQDLIEARAEAESSNNAKSAFMAVTSHELRTPLTTIIGFLELLKLDYATGHGDLSDYLELMHKSSKGLLRLIEDILDFTKTESKVLKLDIKAIDMPGFVKQVQARWQMRFAADQHAAVAFRFEACGPDAIHPNKSNNANNAKSEQAASDPLRALAGTIKSDPLRLNQLLDNMLSNALKFTQTGSVTLRVERRTDAYIFQVLDTGCGIDPAHELKIFEPFYQVDDAMTRRSDGTGLGLSICKNLSQILGGSIALLHSDDNGSCFELRIPFSGLS